MGFLRESRLYRRGDLIMLTTDTNRFKIRANANEENCFTTFYKQDTSDI